MLQRAIPSVPSRRRMIPAPSSSSFVSAPRGCVREVWWLRASSGSWVQRQSQSQQQRQSQSQQQRQSQSQQQRQSQRWYCSSKEICFSSSSSSSFSSLSSRRTTLTTTSETTTTTKRPPSYCTSEQQMVMEECRKLHNSILPLNEKIRGPLSSQSDQATALPFVLLLGNHSSGKSSFINHVLGRTIQTTGVAPTDDSFTIVAPGPKDQDQDGPAVIGDPDLGFAPLRQFGPTLMHHVQLKIRSNIQSNFLMVDTPGMIDAPSTYSGMLQPSSSTKEMDRGYDFTGVAKWLAHRADVVLLFFDPEKPGTTGETLSILLHALSGMDHKLLIVLNKADQFSSSIHDFARAYGSLCWNLSKVIPRKDLPRIFTMCLPVPGAAQPNTNNNNSALHDLFTAREEVVAEVRKAPARRMDNWITGLHDSVSQLLMHATLIQYIQQRYKNIYWHYKWHELLTASTGISLTALIALYGEPVLGFSLSTTNMTVAALGTATVFGTGGFIWYHTQQLQIWQDQQSKRETLFQTFATVYQRDIEQGDEYIAAIWQRIRPTLAMALQAQPSTATTYAMATTAVTVFPATVTQADLVQLQSILKHDIPRLRRMASPSHYGKEEEEEDNDEGSSFSK